MPENRQALLSALKKLSSIRGTVPEEEYNRLFFDCMFSTHDFDSLVTYITTPDVEWQRRRLEIILDLLSPEDGDQILDLGCGVGTFAFHSAIRGAEVTGIDYSSTALKTAQDIWRQYGSSESSIDFILADGTCLPLPHNRFNKVVMADFMEHLTGHQKIRVLKEVRRVLRPGGFVIVWTPNRWQLEYNVLLSRIRRILTGKPIFKNEMESLEGLNSPAHIGIVNPREMRKFLRQSGFNCSQRHQITSVRILSRIQTKHPAIHEQLLSYLARIPLIRDILAEDIVLKAHLSTF